MIRSFSLSFPLIPPPSPPLSLSKSRGAGTGGQTWPTGSRSSCRQIWQRSHRDSCRTQRGHQVIPSRCCCRTTTRAIAEFRRHGKEGIWLHHNGFGVTAMRASADLSDAALAPARPPHQERAGAHGARACGSAWRRGYVARCRCKAAMEGRGHEPPNGLTLIRVDPN